MDDELVDYTLDDDYVMDTDAQNNDNSHQNNGSETDTAQNMLTSSIDSKKSIKNASNLMKYSKKQETSHDSHKQLSEKKNIISKSSKVDTNKSTSRNITNNILSNSYLPDQNKNKSISDVKMELKDTKIVAKGDTKVLKQSNTKHSKDSKHKSRSTSRHHNTHNSKYSSTHRHKNYSSRSRSSSTSSSCSSSTSSSYSRRSRSRSHDRSRSHGRSHDRYRYKSRHSRTHDRSLSSSTSRNHRSVKERYSVSGHPPRNNVIDPIICSICNTKGHSESNCYKNEKNYNRPVCHDFGNNDCQRGDKCKYLHCTQKVLDNYHLSLKTDLTSSQSNTTQLKVSSKSDTGIPLLQSDKIQDESAKQMNISSESSSVQNTKELTQDTLQSQIKLNTSETSMSMDIPTLKDNEENTITQNVESLLDITSTTHENIQIQEQSHTLTETEKHKLFKEQITVQIHHYLSFFYRYNIFSSSEKFKEFEIKIRAKILEKEKKTLEMDDDIIFKMQRYIFKYLINYDNYRKLLEKMFKKIETHKSKINTENDKSTEYYDLFISLYTTYLKPEHDSVNSPSKTFKSIHSDD